MVSALGNGVKGGRWYSLMDKVDAPATLKAAWARVRANKGAAGIDGVSIERFEARAEHYLTELSAELREGRYRPQPVRRVEIPKGDGRTRPLGIPVVKDRIVRAAMKFVIEPIFEAAFQEGSYGFRPGRGRHDALREVDRLVKAGHAHVVDADLAGYFDGIPREPLMARLETRISDGRVLELIRQWLARDVMTDLERWTPVSGTPQGAVISPLLGNIHLDPLDALMAARGYSMVRYADDFVVLCRTAEEADAAVAEICNFRCSIIASAFASAARKAAISEAVLSAGGVMGDRESEPPPLRQGDRHTRVDLSRAQPARPGRQVRRG